jgi:hypothetical protein
METGTGNRISLKPNCLICLERLQSLIATDVQDFGTSAQINYSIDREFTNGEKI